MLKTFLNCFLQAFFLFNKDFASYYILVCFIVTYLIALISGLSIIYDIF